MGTDVVGMSYNIFTGATVLIGIALLLLPFSWKTIKEKRLKYPHLRKGKLGFKADKTQNKRFRDEITRLNVLLWGTLLEVFSIIFTLSAIAGIAFTMVNIHVGPFQADNYNEAKWSLAIGTSLFVLGFFLIGFVLFYENLHFLSNGKTED